MLKEKAALDLLMNNLPKPSPLEMAKLTFDALKQYSQLGFTTVTDLGTIDLDVLSLTFLSFITLCQECPVRIGVFYTPGNKPPVLNHYINKKLWFPGVKIWADGSAYTGTMAVREPYLQTNMTKALDFDPKKPCGLLLYDSTEHQANAVRPYQSDLIATHAHGERAIDQSLDVYELLINEQGPAAADHRYRLEHVGLITKEQLQRATDLGVTVTIFIDHVYFYGVALRDDPLIIVGSPGSSKTLSFNIAVSNLKGQESKKPTFRNTDVFCSLDPHFYQCSRRTTSNEVRTVFSRAITRQRNNAQFSLPIKCVVFMDEAGLPEQSHESLKILHYHLDKPEVSFVAISNTVLDAAKTNRAITLFRDPTGMSEGLEVLATECLFESPESPPDNLKEHIGGIVDLHNAYTHIVTEMNLSKFFGLRDFIHFVHYIRRKCVQRDTNLSLSQVGQLVMESLERNFSGSQQFSEICDVFLNRVSILLYNSTNLIIILTPD